MFDLLQGFSALEIPWQVTTHVDYENAANACEQWRYLTQEQFKAIRKVLFFDKRKDGALGRAVKFPVPIADLVIGDRLEPHSGLRDILDFDRMPLPGWALFWRTRSTTRTMHRNPLFDPNVGVTVDSFAIDTLHTLFLGVIQEFVKTILWMHILAGAWCSLAGRTEEEILKLSTLTLRTKLWNWYSSYHRANPLVSVTELQDLTTGMLGSRGHQALNTKGAETKFLLFFVVELLAEEFLEAGLNARMLAAGRALERHINLVSEAGPILTASQMQDHRLRRQTAFEQGLCNVMSCRWPPIPPSPQRYLILIYVAKISSWIIWGVPLGIPR